MAEMDSSHQSYRDPYKSEVTHIQWTDAEMRSKVLSNVTYSLHLNLAKGTHYTGRITITFDCLSVPNLLWLDFTSEALYSFSINSTPCVPVWEHSHLHLPDLHLGPNTVSLLFTNTYSRDGTGIHHFTDPADGEEYIYTQFEAPYAHLAFPCFDQPDLKAVLELTVTAPAEWKVIGNESGETHPWERSSSLIDSIFPSGEYKLHVFRPTKRISTYLFAVCAGPYAEWKMEENEAGVPLGLYCRQSLAKYCTPERIFRWTVNGFLFYTRFFGVDYPFGKYDQVYAPEFKFGAMENVGCVTYRDDYVFRDEPSPVLLAGVCNTFLHEMAHMWFGNLVTMKWWEDLWLNESFATYISHVCQDRQLHSEFPTVWNNFLTRKGRGYSADQLSTTHPISVRINHTGETETIFDGISYSKGSSVLKQLHYLLGNDVFTSSLQEYIQSNLYKNTTYQDLISVISKHAKNAKIEVDVESWSDMWVKAAGLNQIEASFEAKNGKISRFVIRQSAVLAQFPTLRTHKILVELYDEEMRAMWSGPLVVQAREETEFKELVGKKTPSCVILNAEDHGFVKVVVDPVSLPFLQTHLTSLPSSLTKQVTLRAIWDMVRDTRFSGVQFIDLVVNIVKQETDLTICNYLLELAVAAIGDYLPQGMVKKTYASKVFEAVVGRMNRSQSSQETILFQKRLLSLLCHPCDILRAKDWLVTGTTGIPHFSLGQTDRWRILAAYSSLSPSAFPLISQELLSDNTSSGRNFALMCEASLPIPTLKDTIWKRITHEASKYSNYELEYLTRGFNHWSQGWLTQPYCEVYADMVGEVVSRVEKELGRIVVTGLIPSYAEDERVLAVLEELLPKIPRERVDLVRKFREEIDILKRVSQGKLLSYRHIYSLSIVG